MTLQGASAEYQYPITSSAYNAQPPQARPSTINLVDADFQAFEQNLKGVNEAWSHQDMHSLQAQCTPEMAQYFADDLASLTSRGLRNETKDVHMDRGDLSEAWTEQGKDYATVAMRFSMLDITFRVSDNAIIEGSPTERVQSTEVWTFVRAHGGQWLLSAIQQT
jgi:predicted lipid-binding transport protein (Tim44 family)